MNIEPVFAVGELKTRNCREKNAVSCRRLFCTLAWRTICKEGFIALYESKLLINPMVQLPKIAV